MKHLIKFNESVNSEKFKNTDDDIKLFFIDYIDANPQSFSIKNALLFNNTVVPETSYIPDISKYRKCKIEQQ